jgi:hypothetical protein
VTRAHVSRRSVGGLALPEAGGAARRSTRVAATRPTCYDEKVATTAKTVYNQALHGRRESTRSAVETEVPLELRSVNSGMRHAPLRVAR